jgi:hypothetical protein
MVKFSLRRAAVVTSIFVTMFLVFVFLRKFVGGWWSDPTIINFLAAWIPFVISIFIAFVPEHEMTSRQKWIWRSGGIIIGFIWSVVLWHQQVIVGLEAKRDQTEIVTKAVTQSNQHADEKIAGVRDDVLEAITGGKSYARVRVSYGGNNPSRIGLLAEIDGTDFVGSFRWEAVQLQPPGNDIIKKAYCQAQNILGGALGGGDTGPIQPRSMPVVLPITITPMPTGITQYRTVMEAKNGRFVQCLDVKPRSNGTWESQSVVWLRNTPVLVEKWPD